MLVKISVEQRHIDQGLPGEPACCPIALAIEEKIPGSEPSVMGSIVKCSGGRTANLPDHVWEWEARFDDLDEREYLRPLEFELFFN